MDFVRQTQGGEPTPSNVVSALNKYERLFNLYKRGMDVEKIEKLRFPVARYITTILCNYMLGQQPHYNQTNDADANVGRLLNDASAMYRRQSKGRLAKEIKRQCGKTGFA